MKGRLFNIGVYLAALTALLDQASKWWVLNNPLANTQIHRVNDYLNLRLSWNKGVTFGLLNHHSDWAPFVLAGAATAIVLLLLGWLRRSETLYAGLGLGLIIGGAVGNVIDRLRFGAVVDFIDVHYENHHWYTFNLADSAIFCGVCLLLIENLAMRRKAR